MKKRNKVTVGKRPKPQWLAADIAEFDGLLKRLVYPNKIVQDEARNAMGRFTLAHGSSKCGAMAAHLDAGGAMVDGPRVEVQS